MSLTKTTNISEITSITSRRTLQKTECYESMCIRFCYQRKSLSKLGRSP